MATAADPDVRVFYECCSVIAVAPPEEPCWQCGETAKTVLMATLASYHPVQRVWQLRKQSATRAYI